MTPEIMETVLFMLAVLAAVAVAAQAAENWAPSILLVVAGIGMALDPRIAANPARTGTGAAGHSCRR